MVIAIVRRNVENVKVFLVHDVNVVVMFHVVGRAVLMLLEKHDNVVEKHVREM